MVALEAFFTLLFDPLLWAIPFVVLLVLCVYKIMTNGVDSRFDFGFGKMKVGESVKVYGTANILMFSILWLVALYVYTILPFDKFMAIYLCFCTIFAAYGISELYARIIWFRTLVGDFGLIPVLKGAMYPLFFVINHVPLYVFLKDYSVWNRAFDTFLQLQVMHLLLYIVHGYKARIIQHRKKVIKKYYYLGRAIAITSYIILLVGFLYA